jgi:hypothetical protein
MGIERIPLNEAAIEADGEPRIADARAERSTISARCSAS